MHFLNVAAPSPSEMMLLPLTWQHQGGFAGREAGPALSPCPHPQPCSVPSHPAAVPTLAQLQGNPSTSPGRAVHPCTAWGEHRSPATLACTWGWRTVFARPHTPQWMTLRIVAWGKDPVFTRSGLNLCTEMLAGWISSAGVAAPTQFGLVCKWIQRDVTPTVSPPGYPQNHGTCWPFLGTHGSYGTLHPLPGTHRTVAFTVPFWRPTNLWHSPPPPGDPQSRGTRRLCPVPGSGGGSGRIAA